MNENVFDAEYEKTSLKENGIPENRDDRTKDIKEFCEKTIVFENNDSILDAVMSVSKDESASESLESIHQTGIVEDSMEAPIMNGHFESPATEQLKQNICVSEFVLESVDDEFLVNGNNEDISTIDEESFTFKNKIQLPDVVVTEVIDKEVGEEVIVIKDSTSENNEEMHIMREDFVNLLDSNLKNEETSLNKYLGAGEGVGVTLMMNDDELTMEQQSSEVVDEVLQLEGNKDLHNGHEIINEHTVFNEDVLKKSDSKDDHFLSNGRAGILEESDVMNTKEFEQEHILKEDTGKNVLSFIKNKTWSLGRPSKKKKLNSKSENEIEEENEKSVKKPLFKMFSKNKQSKEVEKEESKEVEKEENKEVEKEENKEIEFEDNGGDTMSKSCSKMPEEKHDNKALKFLKNVFHKSDKKDKQEVGDTGGVEEDTQKVSDGELIAAEKPVISTEHVLPTFFQNSEDIAANSKKLSTITELEMEKVGMESTQVGVKESSSTNSQENYHCAAELEKGGDEIFHEMVNKNYNAPEGEEKGEMVGILMDLEEVEKVGEVCGEPMDAVKTEFVVGEEVVKVESAVGSRSSEAELLREELSTEAGEVSVVEGLKEVSSEVVVESDILNQQSFLDQSEISQEVILTQEETKIENGVNKSDVKNGEEAKDKAKENEARKSKKKNFMLTLPSFTFSGFSKSASKNVENELKEEDRRSLDDLDKATKNKKVKKRTKSFHFGRRAKKEVQDERMKESFVNVEVAEEVKVLPVEAIKEEIKSPDQVGKHDENTKSKFGTLKWPKFSKKSEKKEESVGVKEGESKHNDSKKRHNTFSRGFRKLFSRRGSEGRDLNGMVYSLEDNMVIAADKSVSFGGSYESSQALQEADSSKYFVVVAIDFGTTFSGYAFSFVNHHSEDHPIHIMRKWEGGDPGVNNQKTPTIILFTPNQDFHTFGFTARDFYHNLDATEASKWLYFDKFKMALHDMDIHENLTIPAANGVHVSALKLFSSALNYFKGHAIKELTSQSETEIKTEDIRWVITVPAIWKAPAKQFMRRAAHMAEITSVEGSSKLLIALEPEAASIYIRKLKRSQLVPEKPTPAFVLSDVRPSSPHQGAVVNGSGAVATEVIDDQLKSGTRYIVVDCGGGTVDLTVHEMEKEGGLLKELYKATGGPYGSTGVDHEFEKLLRVIFGSEFIDSFKLKRPAGWVDLMIAFESRKRTCSPFKDHQHNISMPFSFIDFHKKQSHNTPIDEVVRRHNDSHIKWSPQGMLRLSAEAMCGLFEGTVASVINLINNVLVKSRVQGIEYLFLVGGFSESPLLQNEVRKHFEAKVKVIIPQDVSLTILRGAVCYGLEPTVVSVRRSHLTYGIGVVHKFLHAEHDPRKLVRRDGIDWCADVFDTFVLNNQAVPLNDSVIRRYAAIGKQDCVTICVYSSDERDVKYVTDAGVRKCATLTLKLDVPEVVENGVVDGGSGGVVDGGSGGVVDGGSGGVVDGGSGGVVDGGSSGVVDGGSSGVVDGGVVDGGVVEGGVGVDGGSGGVVDGGNGVVVEGGVGVGVEGSVAGAIEVGEINDSEVVAISNRAVNTGISCKSVKEANGYAVNASVNGVAGSSVKGVVTSASNGNVVGVGGMSSIKQIDAVMTFGDTEIKVTALEVDTGKSVKAAINFLDL